MNCGPLECHLHGRSISAFYTVYWTSVTKNPHLKSNQIYLWLETIKLGVVWDKNCYWEQRFPPGLTANKLISNFTVCKNENTLNKKFNWIFWILSTTYSFVKDRSKGSACIYLIYKFKISGNYIMCHLVNVAIIWSNIYT